MLLVVSRNQILIVNIVFLEVVLYLAYNCMFLYKHVAEHLDSVVLITYKWYKKQDI